MSDPRINANFIFIDIDDYIEMWEQDLLSSNGVVDLMNALIAKYLEEKE